MSRKDEIELLAWRESRDHVAVKLARSLCKGNDPIGTAELRNEFKKLDRKVSMLEKIVNVQVVY